MSNNNKKIIDKDKRLTAIKNRIDYCEKRGIHKRIVKELNKKYNKLSNDK